MGMPQIIISFAEKAASAIKRGDRGVLALIVKDRVPDVNPFVCNSSGDVPETMSAVNKEQIALALKGYVNAPKKAVVYVLPEEAEDYEEALTAFSSVKFNWLVGPSVETDGQKDRLAEYVKKERADNHLIKAVLPNLSADAEGIVNFATEKIFAGEEEYDTEEYCGRIAGLIAGTPMSISATYAALTEVTDCSKLNKEQMDEAVDKGKFIIFNDGEKVKTGRAVNSLLTLTGEKGSSYQKIKIVEAMDMIADDIRTTAEDNYIGKYANTYDNKCLLIAAINNYFAELVKADVISRGTVGIDMEANRSYLRGKGIDVDVMSDDDVKTADTGSYVFLSAVVKILDAIEDIVLPITV